MPPSRTSPFPMATFMAREKAMLRSGNFAQAAARRLHGRLTSFEKTYGSSETLKAHCHKLPTKPALPPFNKKNERTMM